MDYRQIIQRSLDYIEDNLKTQISAGELADQAGFSLYHYYRVFQSETGMPVMQYILRRRLVHAIYEMDHGCAGIDAALRYGFDTYAGFYKAFLREFGCTPACYRKCDRVRAPYRINLYKEEHMIVTRKRAAEVLKNWDLKNETVADIYYEDGEKNERAFYVGEDYVLKCSGVPGQINTHIALSNAMESVGVQAATPVKTRDGRQYIQDGELYFVLTHRVRGKQISVDMLYGEHGAEKAEFIGRILGQLHQALVKMDAAVNDVDLYGIIKNWALPGSKEILNLPQSFCEKYLADFGKLYEVLPRQIIHRDPNPGNIIVNADAWGFIDFDLSERNVRIYDLCYAATAILSESFDASDTTVQHAWLEIYRNLIRGYDSTAKLSEQERAAIPYVILANQLVCVAWFHEQERYSEMYETNKQMTRWIIDNFAAL